MHQEYQYLNLLKDILQNGRRSHNRTGTDTLKVIGRSMTFDLMDGARPILPLLTTKKVFFKGVKEELLWFLKGSTNAQDLIDKGVHIWDQWMLPEDVTGDIPLSLGPRFEAWGRQQTPPLDINEAHCEICRQAQQRYYEETQDAEWAPGITLEGSLYQRMALMKRIEAILDEAGIPAETPKVILPKGSLGPIYGASFRHYPAGNYFYQLTTLQLKHYMEHLASDQKALLIEQFGERGCAFTNEATVKDTYHLREALTALGIDQVSQAIGLLKTNPDSRRILIDLWNPQAVPPDGLSPQDNVKQGFAALAFCHLGVQFLTEELTEEERIDLFKKDLVKHGVIESEDQFTMGSGTANDLRQSDGRPYPTHRLHGIAAQRSVDVPGGAPFNIASYALLTHMAAQVCNMIPGTLTWNGADCHIYVDQIEAIKVQLEREPYPFPTLKLAPGIREVTAFASEDIALEHYQHHDAIKIPIAV